MNVAAGTTTNPYVTRGLPRALVFGAFVLVTLPLSAYLLTAGDDGRITLAGKPIAEIYFVLFGLTHFFLTFVVYLSASDVRHFASSRKNMFAFYLAPLVALFGLALFYGLALDARFALAGLVVSTIIRALDFHHLSRQSFGVLQLFKGKPLRQIPAWTRTAENLFFMSLTMLMMLTFLSDLRYDARSPITLAFTAASAALLVVVLAGYSIGLRRGADRRQMAIALGYFAVQTTSSLLAVWRTGLYTAALAVHYVEYHVIMAPRVFRTPADDRDRVLAALRRAPLRLYAALVALSAAFFFMQRAQPGLATGHDGARLLVHLFDGIFVFHYVIEMSIWKFSDPYFRKRLGPLYM